MGRNTSATIDALHKDCEYRVQNMDARSVQEGLFLRLKNTAKFNWFALRRMASLTVHLNM
jgi:hypothetical protein